MKTEVGDGRLYIPKEKREKYGDRFRMIDLEEGILLVPVSDDPLARLREITSDSDKSSRELLEETRSGMIDQAGK